MSDTFLFPITIIKDRYDGTYSNGKWLAFNLDAHLIPSAVDGDDIEAANFWADQAVNPQYIVGKGGTPNTAELDLREQIADHPTYARHLRNNMQVDTWYMPADNSNEQILTMLDLLDPHDEVTIEYLGHPWNVYRCTSRHLNPELHFSEDVVWSAEKKVFNKPTVAKVFGYTDEDIRKFNEEVDKRRKAHITANKHRMQPGPIVTGTDVDLLMRVIEDHLEKSIARIKRTLDVNKADYWGHDGLDTPVTYRTLLAIAENYQIEQERRAEFYASTNEDIF